MLPPEELAEMRQIREANQMRGIFAGVRQALQPDQVTYEAAAPPSAEIREAANATHRLLLDELELGRWSPDLRWCEPVDPEQLRQEKELLARYPGALKDLFDGPVPERFTHKPNIRGCYIGAKRAGYPVIWICNDLDMETTMLTVVHECGHAAGMNERQALAFEQEWAARLGLKADCA